MARGTSSQEGHTLLLACLTILALIAGLIGGHLLTADVMQRPPPTPVGLTLANQVVTSMASNSAGELRPRAVLLSLQGARADFLETYIVDGTMSNLALLASSGLLTEHVRGVDPTSPVVSHASLAAGNRPWKTGIVGEHFKAPDQAVHQIVDASAGIGWGVPPIWAWDEPVQGCPDAVLFWPGVHERASHGAEIVLNVGGPLADAKLHELVLGAPAEEVKGLPTTHSPYKVGTVSIEDRQGHLLASLELIAMDAEDDGQVTYGTLAIRLDPSAPNSYDLLTLDGWLTLRLPGRPAAGVTLKLVDMQPADASPSGEVRLALYQSQVVELMSIPATLAEEIVDQVGAPAAVPDTTSVRRGVLQPGDYATLAERHLRWLAEATAYVVDRHTPRLTVAAFPVVEQASQMALGSSDANLYEPMLRQAYRAADWGIGRLLAGLDLSRTAVFIGSPHGYAGIHTALNMRALLDELYPGDGQAVLVPYSSGGAAHIRINLAGREPGGVVSAADYDAILAQLTERLSGYQIGEQPVFERVASGDGLRGIFLSHPNSGDVFVQAYPGFLLMEGDPSGEGRLSWPAVGAASGYATGRVEMQGSFVMAGYGIQARGVSETLELVDLAPTLAHILGGKAPPEVEGRILNEVLQR